MLQTWRKGEHEFEVERVELGEQKDEDDPEDRQPSLQRRQGVPGELDPAVRTARRTTKLEVYKGNTDNLFKERNLGNRKIENLNWNSV